MQEDGLVPRAAPENGNRIKEVTENEKMAKETTKTKYPYLNSLDPIINSA